MRSEWVPVPAAALVTGVMALVLGQMLNPAGGENPADQLLIAAESSGRWLAMSLLFFGGAAAMILGMPAVMTLFRDRRGRGIGLTGVAAFVVGCVGVGGLASTMLLFRALALEAASETVGTNDIALVTSALQDKGFAVSLGVWVYGFMLGILLIAIGLFRSRQTPGWVPALLLGFLAVQVVIPVLGEGTPSRVGSAVGLILMAAGFTGIATSATSPRNDAPVTHSLVRG